MKFVLIIPLVLLSLTSCFSFGDKEEEDSKVDTPTIGNVKLNYYSNKSVSSLKVPPDLTLPSQENAFKIGEFAKVQEHVISFSEKDKIVSEANSILRTPSNVSVEKYGPRRWLRVNKKADDVWDLSRAFLKQQGFAINYTNKKIGVIETDYVENKPYISDQNVGLIRSMIRKATGQSYSLPVIDKYRIRIEPLDEKDETEVHLSLTSFHEIVINQGKGVEEGENTIWQPIEKDTTIETEMLYRLMVFLGGEASESIEKIKTAQEKKIINVKVSDGLNGFAKLVFNSDLYSTWDNMSWALDQRNITLEDKDIKEKTFYIKSTATEEPSFFSKLFQEITIQKSYQLQLKSIGKNITEVYFNDISEENDQETKDYSYELFKYLVSVF